MGFGALREQVLHELVLREPDGREPTATAGWRARPG